MMFLAKEGITPLTLSYKASPELSTSFEPILARLGWSPPRTDFVLLEGHSHQLAAIDWADRFPIAPPKPLPWHQLSKCRSTKPAPSALPPNCNPC